MELNTVTVRTASRTPLGRNAFQEVGVSLSYSVRDEAGADAEQIAARAAEVLERAFHAVWLRLEGLPDPK